jgi:hypothetical protein
MREEVMLVEIEPDERIGIQDKIVLVLDDISCDNLYDLLCKPRVRKLCGKSRSSYDILGGQEYIALRYRIRELITLVARDNDISATVHAAVAS